MKYHRGQEKVYLPLRGTRHARIADKHGKEADKIESHLKNLDQKKQSSSEIGHEGKTPDWTKDPERMKRYQGK